MKNLVLQILRQLILDLTDQKIDFVILDEVHFAKKREDDNPRYTRMISEKYQSQSV